MPKTPTSLKVVGILGIIYSSIGLLSAPCGIIQMVHPLSPDPIMDQLRQDRTYVAYSLGAGALGLCLAILLLAASIGCLKVKPWARLGMNVYAVVQAIVSAVGTIFGVLYVLPRMRDAMAAMPPGPGTLPPGTMEMIMLVSFVVGMLFVMGVVLTILIICNRKSNVDAFNGIFPEETTESPADYPPPPAV